jgi:hypothetical protein
MIIKESKHMVYRRTIWTIALYFFHDILILRYKKKILIVSMLFSAFSGNALIEN